MKPIRTFEQERRRAGATKWSSFDAKYAPLWVADMDFAVCGHITEALRNRLEHTTFGYTNTPDSLNDAVLSWCKRRYAWNIDPEHIIWMQGLVPGFHLMAEVLCAQDEAIVAPSPNYPPILNAGDTVGRKTAYVSHYYKDNRWCLDLEQLDEALAQDKTRFLLLANPANPLGYCLTREELKSIAASAEKNNVIVCSDEIHCDLIFNDKPHIPFGSVSEHGSITMMAASKTFNIAGLNTSYAIIPDPKLRKRLKKAIASRIGSPNLLGLIATEAALTKGQDWRDQLIKQLDTNRQIVHQFLIDNQYSDVYLPEATHLYWIKESANRWMENHIMPSKGIDFGDAQYTRINFACSEDLLKESLARMAK